MASEAVQESTESPFIPESISSHDLAVSNFSQVIFPDIPDFFPPENDINVSYILTEAIEPSSRDWIGLFRVGWASPRDYSTYVWAPKPANNSLGRTRAQSVAFQAYQLPGDDKEFYQFCYVTRQGYVRGASTPFQFRHGTENDCLVEMEDESGMIILRTKSDALEEQLSDVMQEKDLLQEKIDDLTKSKSELADKVKALESELAGAQKKCEESETEKLELSANIEKLNKDLEEAGQRLKEADTKLESNQSLLDAAKKTIDNLKRQIETLEELKQNIVDEKTKDLEKYLDDLNGKETKILEQERQKMEMLEKIKSLTLAHETAQQQNAASQAAKEERAKAELKAKEDLSVKLQYCKDERDLFKNQFEMSELSRQEVFEELENIKKKLNKAEKVVQNKVDAVEEKENDLKIVEEKLAQLEKKNKHEMKKSQEILRNALEQANAEKAAKQVLSKELSEASAARDQLINELNKIKKEKESLTEEMRGSQSLVRSLQAQLETTEEKLAKSELILLDHDRLVGEERRKIKEMEKEMNDQVILLQNQLQEANSAVAASAALHTSPVAKKNKKIQADTDKESGECQETSNSGSKTVEELQLRVEELTTRLNMGADAYKDKFLECHKLERKMKKMKQLLARQEAGGLASSPPSTKTTDASTEEEPQQQGWGTAFEKFITAITDPDAEEKEQSKQIQQKIESLQKNVEFEQGRHKKYKQLFNDEKQKMKQSKERESELTSALDEAEARNQSLSDENKMLKAQLEEFVGQYGDGRMKKMISVRPAVSSDDLSSSPEIIDAGDDGLHFKDALDVPVNTTHRKIRAKLSTSETSTGSDASDEGSYQGNGSFSKFNICADRSEEGTSSCAIPQTRKPKVISHQPIRAPPSIPEIVRAPSEQKYGLVSSNSGEARKRTGKRSTRKTKKNQRV